MRRASGLHASSPAKRRDVCGGHRVLRLSDLQSAQVGMAGKTAGTRIARCVSVGNRTRRSLDQPDSGGSTGEGRSIVKAVALALATGIVATGVAFAKNLAKAFASVISR